MRSVIALLVGLALACLVWGIGAAVGGAPGAPTQGVTTYGVPPAANPRPVGRPPTHAPDIPVPTHSAADLEAALPPPSPVVGNPGGTGRIEEDEPGWDCATMGNRSCG